MKVADPVSAVDACLERIERLDGEIRAWAYVDRDGSRAAARRLAALPSAQRDALPLFGVPFAAKDIFDTADMPTCWGSALYAGRRPSADAALVAQLRSLGAILIGKTHTTAFAYYDPGPTRNPHALDHTPGGSSSGSAAAVAAGMVPLALGSQTQGSVLRPASFCGVVGFKPTFGKLSLEGVLPFAPSLDHAGLFAADVADLTVAWKALTPAASTVEPARRLWAPDWPGEGEVDAVMQDALATRLDQLRSDGFEIQRTPRPDWLAPVHRATRTIMAAEACQVHRDRFEQHGDALGAKLSELLRAGSSITDQEVFEAKSVVAAARRAFAADLAPGTLVAAPAALGPAPRGLDSTGNPAANIPCTTLGLPAISIPFARDPAGIAARPPTQRSRRRRRPRSSHGCRPLNSRGRAGCGHRI